MKILETIIAAIIAIFAPIAPMISVCILVIIVDLITGLIAAKKRKEELKSSGIGRTFSKLTVTLLGICIAYLVETRMGVGAYIPLTNLIAAVRGLQELKSILENLDTINGSSVYTSIIKKLGSVNDQITSPENLVKKEDQTKEKDPTED